MLSVEAEVATSAGIFTYRMGWDCRYCQGLTMTIFSRLRASSGQTGTDGARNKGT